VIDMTEDDLRNMLSKYPASGGEYTGEVETPDWYNKAMSVIGGAIAEPFTQRPRDRLKSLMDEATLAQLDQTGVELPKMASNIINTDQGPIPVDMEGNPLDWERMSATKYLINQLGNVMGGIVGAPVRAGEMVLGSGPVKTHNGVSWNFFEDAKKLNKNDFLDKYAIEPNNPAKASHEDLLKIAEKQKKLPAHYEYNPKSLDPFEMESWNDVLSPQSAKQIQEVQSVIQKNEPLPPILVEGSPYDTKYRSMVLDGHHRTIAALNENASSIPVFFTNKTLNEIWNHLNKVNKKSGGGSEPLRKLADEIHQDKYIPHDSPERAKNLEDWLGYSVVRNKDGSPKTIYHGTASDISTFKPSNTGEFGPGVYATDLTDEASSYAGTHQGGRNVMPLHVRMEQPFVVKDPAEFWERFGGATDSDAVKNARNAGYDGVMIQRPYTLWDDRTKQFYPTGQDHTHYVVFDPSQIKSATGNRGTFDMKNPDITKSHGGSVKGYALGGQADIAQTNIDLLNEMARRYKVADDAQSQDAADRYAEMVSAMNAGVTRGDNTSQQTPTSTNFTTNTPATVAYDPHTNDLVPYSNANYQPGAVQSYNLSNLSPSQQAAVITSSQTNPTSTQTAATTPITNTNVAALPSPIEGFAPSSRGVGNLVSPGFTDSGKIASRADETLPGYLGAGRSTFVDESRALAGAYGQLPSSVTNVSIPPEQLADWLAVQQEMFGDERAAAIAQGIINGDLSLFGEGQMPNVGAPQENFNGLVAGTNPAGTFDPLDSLDVLGDINYGTFGLSGPMGLSNAIQEMQDQQEAASESEGPEDGGPEDGGPEDGGPENDSSDGGDGDYALGGTVNKNLMKLYRKYSKKSRKYAQGGPVAVYDPAEIDAIAASIREGNYA